MYYKMLQFFLLSSIFCLLVSPPAYASSITVYPSIMNIALSPGKTTTPLLTIGNNGDTPLPVRLQFEPLFLNDDPTPLQSMQQWVSISKSSLLIPARSKEIVPIRITLPKSIALGGYYGMIYIEPLTSVKNNSGSQVTTKVAALLLGSVGVNDVPLSSIEILTSGTSDFISESKTLHLPFQVKNTSLNHISAKPFLKIHPLFGKSEVIPLEERLVFPGKKRIWNSTFTVSQGTQLFYNADLYVALGNGKSQKKSFSFIIFPVQQSIILVLCTAAGISMIRKRKQIKKAARILIKG